MQLPKILSSSERKLNTGNMLLELCITLALCSIILTSLSVAVTSSNIQSKSLEKLRENIFQTQADLNAFLHFYSSTSTQSGFTSTSTFLNITNVTPCRIYASGLNLSVLALNSQELISRGNDCEGNTFLPTGSTTLVTSLPLFQNTKYIDVKNNFLFNLASSSLYIHDVSNTPNPVLLSHIDLPDAATVLDAANSYEFIGLDSTSSQVQIIDSSDVSNSKIISQATLPGVSGSFPGALSIFYYDSKLYVGTHRTAGHEFHIFNITNSSAPIWLGSVELNHNINKIIVRDNYAYLGTSGNTKDVIILDTHDPAHIAQVSSIDIPGSEDTTSIFLLGNVLYVGRKKNTGSTTHPEIYTIDISDPVNPKILNSLDTNSSVIDLIACGNYIYALLADKSLAVVSSDVTTNQLAILEKINLPDVPVNLDIQDNYLFVSMKSVLNIFSL